MKFVFNQDKSIRDLEKKALSIDSKSTKLLNSYYYSNFNFRTGDMNIFCYEYKLKEIIKRSKS